LNLWATTSKFYSVLWAATLGYANSKLTLRKSGQRNKLLLSRLGRGVTSNSLPGLPGIIPRAQFQPIEMEVMVIQED